MSSEQSSRGVHIHFVKCKSGACDSQGPKNSDPNAAIDAWNDWDK
ncbi:hypothetical protein KHY18_06660 [Acidovorax sp. CCYZU-2555]|nr:hypothetical protein [Acidovorax sp. CCYZU-2555]